MCCLDALFLYDEKTGKGCHRGSWITSCCSDRSFYLIYQLWFQDLWISRSMNLEATLSVDLPGFKIFDFQAVYMPMNSETKICFQFDYSTKQRSGSNWHILELMLCLWQNIILFSFSHICFSYLNSYLTSVTRISHILSHNYDT